MDNLLFKRLQGKKSMLNFGLDAIVNFQYKLVDKNISRDLEVSALESRVMYSNTNSEILEPAVPIFACKFYPGSIASLAAAADEYGTVSLHSTNSSINNTTTSRAHNNAIFDLAWVPGQSKLLTLSGDHTARLWDVVEIGIGPLSTFQGHSKSVKTADFMPDEPGTFATGSRDGSILLWDSRCSNKSVESVFKPDQFISNAVGLQKYKKSEPHSVTSLVFQDKNTLICCGASDNLIRVWDMRMTHYRWKATQPKMTYKATKRGFTDLKMNPEKSKLYASCMNSSIFCFNLHSSNPEHIAEYSGHQAGSFYVKTSISSDGEYLVSGSTDKNIYVWRTKGAEFEREPRLPITTLSGHTAEVTGVDISFSSMSKIISCADDGSVRLWQPQVKTADSINDRFSDLSLKKENGSKSASGSILPLTTFFQTPPRKAVRTSELPSNVFKRKASETSPTRATASSSKRLVLSPSKKSNSMYISPTANLPNYVLDGGRPSHSCPRLRHKENNVDWLTELQRRSNSKRPKSNTEKKTNVKQLSGKSSRRTLLEYYKKSGRCCDEGPAPLKPVPDLLPGPN